MKGKIVDIFEPLTLIGGGESGPEDLKLAISLAPTCVAADGGAQAALASGVELTAVIGDMDSITDSDRAQIPPDRIYHIAEQDSTDFDKALRHIAAPVIIAVGFTGGRIDHELAAFHTLVSRPDRHVLLLGAEDIVFVCPRDFALSLPADTRVSLFPLGPVRGRSRGLYWPIDGIDFAPGLRSGTSNRATGDIALEMEAPRMLCILPRAFIRQVVSALLQIPEHARWPARAGSRKDPPAP